MAVAEDGRDRTAEHPQFPDPDDPRKPDQPRELHKRSWLGVLKRTATEFKDDNCTDWAAALTYYGVLAMFPAAVALLLSSVGRRPPQDNRRLARHRRDPWPGQCHRNVR